MAVIGATVALALCAQFLAFSASPPPARNEAIIRNEGRGLWEKDKSGSMDLIPELSIGEDESDSMALFGLVGDIAVDSLCTIYVLDSRAFRINVYDSAGAFQFTFGRQGNGPGEFAFPTALCFDAANNLLVADGNKIQVFDTRGGYVASHALRTASPVRSMRCDRAGNIFVACLDVVDQNIVHKYSAQGGHLASFCPSFAKDKDVDLRIEASFGGGSLCIGDDDILYYTQLLPYEIRKYSLDGELLARIYRGNVPVKSPENSVRGDGETMIFTMPAMSSSIIAAGDGFFINTILVPAEDGAENHSLVDLYDVSGRYLATKKFDGLLSFKSKDRFGRIYAAEDNDVARVVRYRIVLNSRRTHGEAPQRKGGGS